MEHYSSPPSSEEPPKTDETETQNNTTTLLCRVCEGPKNRVCYYFGVQCCRACASFFHRSVKERRKYTCRSGGQHCQISNDEGLRNSCRACRLKKCLEVGMAVGKKRDRARTEEQHMASPDSGIAEPTSTSCSSILAGVGPSSTDPAIIGLPNIAHFAESMRQYNHAFRALSVVEGICRELTTEDRTNSRLINHDEYARMLKGSIMLMYSMLCQYCSVIRELTKEDRIKVLKLFHNQFVAIHRSYLTEKAGFSPETGVAVLVPGGVLDKSSEHFFDGVDMNQVQRQRLASIIEWHCDFCNKHYLPLSITQNEFAAMTGIIFLNTVEKAIPFAYPPEQITITREQFYGELSQLISSEQPGLTHVQMTIRFGKILDLVNQLMLHSWEMDEMLTMAKIFVDLPDFWDDINLPA